MENAFDHAYWQPTMSEPASPTQHPAGPSTHSLPEAAQPSEGHAEVDDAEFARRMQEDEHRQHLLQMAGIGETPTNTLQ